MVGLGSLIHHKTRKVDLNLQDPLHLAPWLWPLRDPDLAPGCRPPEPEAGGGSVDGRVRRAHLPAPARVPPPLRGGRSRPEKAPQLPKLQEFQVVYDQDRLGPAQILPARGAPGCSLGRGECGGQAQLHPVQSARANPISKIGKVPLKVYNVKFFPFLVSI